MITMGGLFSLTDFLHWPETVLFSFLFKDSCISPAN
jgi:hypothetical protein